MVALIGKDYPDVPDIDPFAPQDGAAVLDEVDALLTRFVVFPSEEARHAVALWCAHAHVLDAFETTPRLAFLSPEPGSGKTRALEIVELLVPSGMLGVAVLECFVDLGEAGVEQVPGQDDADRGRHSEEYRFPSGSFGGNADCDRENGCVHPDETGHER